MKIYNGFITGVYGQVIREPILRRAQHLENESVFSVGREKKTMKT